MIKLITKGDYQLVGTKDRKIILYLGDQGYHWGYAPKIGNLLTFSKHPHQPSYMLAEGKYKLYEVKHEPALVDLQHLELSLGSHKWQGYLLLTELPHARKLRSRIEPTEEVISK